MTARVRYLQPEAPRVPAGQLSETPRTVRVLLALRRVKRAAQRAALRFVIESNARYIEQCAADGIMDSVDLRYSRAQLAADHVRLALLED